MMKTITTTTSSFTAAGIKVVYTYNEPAAAYNKTYFDPIIATWESGGYRLVDVSCKHKWWGRVVTKLVFLK